MENRRNSFEFEDLLACGRGEMFAEGPQLPLPPMLMFDRISELAEAGGEYGKGLVRATLEVKPDLWFFPCHFKGDPVMPGCLGLDALWQLLGFFLGWLGSPGQGWGVGQGAGARSRRAQVFRPGAADHEERGLWPRNQAGDALEARSRHRRRVAIGGWHGDLQGARPQGRAIPRCRCAEAQCGVTLRICPATPYFEGVKLHQARARLP